MNDVHPESNHRLPPALLPAVARIAPFAAFMFCIAVEETLGFLISRGMVALDSRFLLWLYLPKLFITALVLLWFWPTYSEIQSGDLRNARNTLFSVLCGVVVFTLWINMDWVFSFQTPPRGFNPELIGDEFNRKLMVVSRTLGAVVMVPVMEELFWRSWLVRYLIRSDFNSVAIGTFTLTSFTISSLLFGLEHHFVLAGIMAGLMFNAICYTTRSIIQCVLAHMVANLLLTVYVLITGAWRFW